MKISGWLLLMPMVIAFILPERAQWIFFWSPTYWSFVALRDILNLSSKWSGFAFQILWICLTTAILFLLMKSKIKGGSRLIKTEAGYFPASLFPSDKYFYGAKN